MIRGVQHTATMLKNGEVLIIGSVEERRERVRKKGDLMLKARRLFLICSLLAFTTVSFAANLPRCEKDLPIFPASIRDRDVEAELLISEPDRPIRGWNTAPKRSSAHLAFTTGMPAEKVLRFYMQMFGVPIREGEPEPPLDTLSFYDLESIGECKNGKRRKSAEGAQVAIAMEGDSRSLITGKRLECASFFWMVEEADGDFSELILQICDRSFNCQKENGQIETEICFSRLTWQDPKAFVAETKLLEAPAESRSMVESD